MVQRRAGGGADGVHHGAQQLNGRLLSFKGIGFNGLREQSFHICLSSVCGSRIGLTSVMRRAAAEWGGKGDLDRPVVR